MPNPFHRLFILVATVASLQAVAPAQQQPNPLADKGPQYVQVSYPRDKDMAIAVVGGKTLTLGQLIKHIEARHYPGFSKLVEKRPEFQRTLRSDLIAPWVRQFADLEALKQTYADELADTKKLEEMQSAALKGSFELYLGKIVEDRQRAGRPTDLKQAQVNRHLSEFQLRRGLSAELQGALDLLESRDYNRKQLRDFFNDNARYFGGKVTIQHLLIQHRDGGTGILLQDEGLARANARVAEVKARLRPDGTNFAELVRLFSDDTRTMKDGGTLAGVHRFDNRLPAALCRAAWQLRDGEVTSDVVETQYGWHFIKRVDFHQNIFILFTEDAMPKIRQVMQAAMQENRLFTAREKSKLRLLL